MEVTIRIVSFRSSSEACGQALVVEALLVEEAVSTATATTGATMTTIIAEDLEGRSLTALSHESQRTLRLQGEG